MVILTQDPSFRALAHCIYDENKTIYVDICSCNLGSNVGFDKVFNACQDMESQYISKIDRVLEEHNLKIDRVFSEVPPPVSQYSPGLFALDTHILSSLWKNYPSISEMYSIPPSYVKTLRGSNNKSDSTQLAKYYMDEVLKDDIDVVIAETISDKGRHMKGVMNNDKAEAFLFMLRVFCKYDILGLKSKIENEISGFIKEPEKLLIQR